MKNREIAPDYSVIIWRNLIFFWTLRQVIIENKGSRNTMELMSRRNGRNSRNNLLFLADAADGADFYKNLKNKKGQLREE